MATINLGNIKFNWKGTYNAGTAYAVDDVVSYNGSSYVCILASTGNLPTNTTYWNVMSEAGTDGTDLTSTLTTQGDIVYRDGSGLARLGAGTSGQVLQTGGTGANPSWGTVSSDFVKIAEFNHSGSTVGYVDVDNVFSATYDIYKVYIENVLFASTGYNLDMRLLTAGGVSSASEYHHAEWGYTAGNASISGYSSGDSRWMIGQDQSSDSQRTGVSEITFYRPTSTTKYKNEKKQVDVQT